MQLVELIFEVLIQGVLYKTGRRVLAWFGLKSNVLVETLLGIVVWAAAFFAGIVVGLFIILLIRELH